MRDTFKASMDTMPDWWGQRSRRKMYRRLARRRMKMNVRMMD